MTPSNNPHTEKPVASVGYAWVGSAGCVPQATQCDLADAVALTRQLQALRDRLAP